MLLPASILSYDRSEWLPKWGKSKLCGDTRSMVLQVNNLYSKKDSCSFVVGKWLDFYDGTYITNPEKIDLDHLVSLNDADVSGGASWTTFQKRTFANDTTNLVITSQRNNRSKSDKSPIAWQPKIHKCEYIIRYIKIKNKYKLLISPNILVLKDSICKNNK